MASTGAAPRATKGLSDVTVNVNRLSARSRVKPGDDVDLRIYPTASIAT
jgi:hypothetical protein